MSEEERDDESASADAPSTPKRPTRDTSGVGEAVGKVAGREVGKRVAGKAAKETAGAVGKSAASAVAGGTTAAGAAAGTAAAAGTTAAASTGAASAVSGATSAAAGGTAAIAKDAVDAGKALAAGNAQEATDAVVRGAAVGTATYFGGTAGGAVARAVLETETGRKVTRWTSRILIGLIVLMMAFPIIIVTSVAGGALSFILGASGSQVLCVDPIGGGVPVTDVTKQGYAAQIVRNAYSKGLGQEGAIIGVMAALAQSDLDLNATDLTQPASTPVPLQHLGVFQVAPWDWVPEIWPDGTTTASPQFTDPAYVTLAREKVLDVNTVSASFFDKFDSVSSLSSGKWKNYAAWDVPPKILGDDGTDYAVQWSTAKSTVATILVANPQIANPTATPGAAQNDLTGTTSVCGEYGAYAGYGAYTMTNGQLASTFTDGGRSYRNAGLAVSRAMSAVGHAELPCPDDRACRQRCDHLAGWNWGYDVSGYFSAREHWAIALSQKIAHPGDTSPPIGALLFWDTGQYGHVATYVGGGYVVSNLYGENGYNVYKVPAGYFSDKWGAPYLGWADPVFYRQPVGSGL